MSYESMMKWMEEMHEGQNRMPTDYVIMMDSYDSAVFQRYNKGNCSILSYNALMWHPKMSWLPKPILTTTTRIIVTFMQVICNKKVETIFPIIYHIYESKRKIRLKEIMF